MEIVYTANVLWSQIDANRHLRHSAYADFCAQARLEALESIGFGMAAFTKLNIGPVLFREELKYKKEIHAGDRVTIKTFLLNYEEGARKWSFFQKIYRGDGELAATVQVDGAWMDVKKRKLTTLPEEIVEKLSVIPRLEEED